MRLITRGIFVVGAASLLALAGCSQDKAARSAATAGAGPVAATVNGKPISEKMVDLVARQGLAGGNADNPETRKAIIDHLALQAVVAQEAVKKGLDKSPEVLAQLDAVRQSVLANAYVQDFLKNNPVTDDQLKAEYDRLKAQMTGTEYKARHILVESEAEAKDIIAKLNKNPALFEKLAAEKSQDPGSKANGGDLGWFDPSRMVPEFGAALAKLEKGKFTEEPVKTRFGYHVILLEDKKSIEPPPLDEIKTQLSQQLQQKNMMKRLEDLRASAKVEVNPRAGAASPPAGAPAMGPAGGASSTPAAPAAPK